MRVLSLFALGILLTGCFDWSEDVLRRDAAPQTDMADSQLPEGGAPDIEPDAPGDQGEDAPLLDAPLPDVQPLDTTVMDAPKVDAPVGDAPVGDAPISDAPQADAFFMDALQVDTSLADALQADAPLPDALQVDTSLPDSLAPDSAPSAPQANGKTCGANSHCLSGICADGVCCNLSCTAPCLSCVVSGKEGFCSVVPAGTKPLTSSKVCSVPPSSFCGYDGYCDGLGQCRNRLAGSICLAQKCNAADVTKVNPASICDGAGKCISLNTSYGSTPCGSYLCDTKTKACHEGCKGGGSECKKGVSCSGGKCGGQKRPLGSTCKKAGDCDSGKCVGKICCDNDCKGACSTCSLAGAEGRCVSVPTGRKPDSGKSCSVKAPCEGDGKCNGAGKCRFYTPAGTPCGTNECKDGPGDSTIKIRACDGAGKCKDKKTNCGNYVCQPKVASCFASCTSNAQCRSKKTCKGNLCL